MNTPRALKIGITCYPSIGGSGILASALGEELARRGHEVHFISYERPFRLPTDQPRLRFHPVTINDYGLFKYPDYTLPLSVKMAEVSRDHGLDVLHVHYAVPHATAAILARDMLPPGQAPRVVTTLHGTDTTLLGRDAGYGPAIRHALERSDAVTAVSAFLESETRRLLPLERSIEVIHNFFVPRLPGRTREAVRRELGLAPGEAMILHASNLRPLKRIDLLLETVARIRPRESFKLVVLAGGDFGPFAGDVRRLGLEDRIVVREQISEIEDYLQAADVALVHVGDGELLSGHPRSHVPRMPERGVCGRRHPRGDRRWGKRNPRTVRRCRCPDARGGNALARPIPARGDRPNCSAARGGEVLGGNHLAPV